VVVVPQDHPLAGSAGEVMTFSVSAYSPLGYPVQVTLTGLVGADDSTLVPQESPLFDRGWAIHLDPVGR